MQPTGAQSVADMVMCVAVLQPSTYWCICSWLVGLICDVVVTKKGCICRGSRVTKLWFQEFSLLYSCAVTWSFNVVLLAFLPLFCRDLCCRFLDRLDPDSSSQPQLGAHQAWLDHPLLDPLCDHPAGVQVLLQRVHISQPPLMLWTQATAAAAGGAALQGTAGGANPAAAAGAAGSGGLNARCSAAGSGGLNARSAGSMSARGLSPGKLVLALLLKMGEQRDSALGLSLIHI